MTEIAMNVKVIQPTILENRLLVLLTSIVLSLEILRIMKRIGTATMPSMTAAYIRAWIGSVLESAIPSPMIVDVIITK